MDGNSQSVADFWQEIWQIVVDMNILNLVWALLILIVGVLLAWFFAGLAGKAVRSFGLDEKLEKSFPGGKRSVSGSKIEKVVSRIVFYMILLLTILGCLTALNLSEAAGPIREFVNTVVGYGANIIAAGLLVFVAWVAASVLEYFSVTVMTVMKLDEKFSPRTEIDVTDGKESDVRVAKPFSQIAGSVIYWIVLLFFVPAILRALNINGITEPLEGMLAKLLGFVPNLIAAGAILVVGLFVARIVRRAVAGLLFLSRLDEFGKKSGGGNLFGERGISYLAGLVAYVLVAIPVVISALNALQIEALTNSVSKFFDMILNATGSVIGAGVLVFVAFIVGGVVAGIVTQLFEGFGFDRLIASLGFAPKSETTVRPSAVVGKLAFLAIMLFAAVSACELLGFMELAALIRIFIVFGGNIIVGVVVMMVGIFLANLAANALRGKGESSEFLATAVRVAVLVFTGAVALSTLNLNGRIVEIAFALLLGAICVAAAIAFGIGGREFAARKLEEWDRKITKK
ncbi:mechanosensitive ion channel [uncultured Victivallis sp.]|uniref:mechanosensitive ion channel n=1 Tax=uncultured Victivallis sp. TaxID=354118 RepID=UPI0025F98F52|nr:mechanosensitive ion channel [uncultured Victivallis sp.]